MEKQRRKRHPLQSGKRLLAILMSVCLITAMLPLSARAENAGVADGLCEHHTEHTADCGYEEPVEGHACGHEHGDVCYTQGDCTHEHTADCYADGVLPEEGEEKNADACSHECTEESGCLVLDCSHKDGGHDEECGYVEASEGNPCTYVCETCEAEGLEDEELEELDEENETEGSDDSDPDTLTEAAQAVQDMIDELPDVEDITEENFEEVAGLLEDIDEAKCELTEEESEALDYTKYNAVVAKMMELLDQAGAEEAATMDLASSDVDGKPSGTVKTINLDPTILRPTADNRWSDNNLLYFGKYGENPVAYRVLASPKTTQTVLFPNDFSGKSLLLDCDTILLEKKFNESQDANDFQINASSWERSDLQKCLNGVDFYSNDSVFKGIEKKAIAVTGLTDCSAKDYVFCLSLDEAGGLYAASKYGKNNGSSWWLRSSYTKTKADYAGESLGAYKYVDTDLGVSPAMNIDLSKVLFASPATDLKTGAETGTLGTLTEVKEAENKEWKLTLIDSGRNTFTASRSDNGTVTAGNTVSIDYFNAKTDENEYVSVLLAKSNGEIVSYGHIAKNSANGEASVTIPSELTAGDYTLKVFNEQCNGAQETDYASNFVDIPITVAEPQKITSVDVTITPPEPKVALAGTATVSGIKVSDTTAATTVVANTSPKITWKNADSFVSGTVAFNTAYTAEVTLSPASGYAFDEKVSANIKEADGTSLGSGEVTKADGSITVSYTFAATRKAKLDSISQTSATISGVANGTAKADLAKRLPETWTIGTEDENKAAKVSWDVENANYDPSKLTEQKFTVNGTVILPDDVDNPGNVPLAVTCQVTVNAADTVAAPTADPAGGTYTSSQSVALSSSTPDAKIYYTTDGTTPTTSATLYTKEITVSSTTTIKAIAVKDDMQDSAVAEFTYTIQAPKPTITKRPSDVTVKVGQSATFTVEASGASSYQWMINRNDGKGWVNIDSATTASYTSNPIMTSNCSGYQYKCVVSNDGGSVTSEIATLTVTSSVEAPTANPAGGTYTSSQSVTLSTTTAGADIYYTLNAGPPSATDRTKYTEPITISSTTTIRAIAVKNGMQDSTVAEFTYTILTITTQPSNATVKVGETAKFTVAASEDGCTYQWMINRNDGNGWKPLDNASATTASYTSANAVDSSCNGFQYQCVVSKGGVSVESNVVKLTVQERPTVVAPTANPAGGIYTSSQSVSLSSSTPDAKIYYTTDGSAPSSTNGTEYTGSITVSSTTTIKAIAVKDGMQDSGVVEFTYTIQALKPAAPTITTQPSNATVKVGETAKFTVAASGEKLTYQWEINRKDGNWVKIIENDSSKTANYISGEVTIGCDGYQYRCVVSNDGGKETSNAVTLTVQELGTVAAPTADLADGTYTSSQTVSLSSSTPDAKIYYTTDGSAPSSTNGTEYTGSITVSSTTTIKAIAVKDGMNDSAVATFTYTIQQGGSGGSGSTGGTGGTGDSGSSGGSGDSGSTGGGSGSSGSSGGGSSSGSSGGSSGSSGGSSSGGSASAAAPAPKEGVSVEKAAPGAKINEASVKIPMVDANGVPGTVDLKTYIAATSENIVNTIAQNAAAGADATVALGNIMTAPVSPNFVATINALGGNIGMVYCGTYKPVAIANDILGNLIASSGKVKYVKRETLLLLVSVNEDGTIDHVEGVVDDNVNVLGLFNGLPKTISVFAIIPGTN